MNIGALTIRGNGRLNVLISQVAVSLPFIGEGADEKIISVSFSGIWDTGATNSVITKKVVDQLELKPVGMTTVHTASGSGNQNVYLVNFTLPNNFTISGIRVTEGQLTGADILIGMDIICLGDFSITNVDGKTITSFRMPSCDIVDYVDEINIQKLPRAERRKLLLEKAKRPKLK